MKSPLLFIMLFSTFSSTLAQPYFDSLQLKLLTVKNDTARAHLLCDLAQYHEYIQSDSNIYYVNKAIEVSEKINYPITKFLALRSMFFAENLKANYPKALEIALNNLSVAKELEKDSLYYMSFAHQDISLVNREMGDSVKAAGENVVAYRMIEASGRFDGDCWTVYARKSASFLSSHPDSAIFYAHKAHELAADAVNRRSYMSLPTATLANTYQTLGDYKSARYYYDVALQRCAIFNNVYIEARVYRDLARLFNKLKQTDSCLYFARLSLELCQRHNFGDYATNVGEILSKLYESEHKPDSALKYMKVMLAARDSIFGQAKIRQFQASLYDADQKQKDAAAAAESYRARVKLYSIIGVATLFLILLMIVYRNNRQKQKAFTLLRQQKQETDEQKLKVEMAYGELKSTQNQLIQSEKMASLGELTAGIAHEIQNPLNFVNNFSEVNRELIQELKNELQKENLPGAIMIANSIDDNEEKINHHGKRADTIVKGMLQHSRVSTGQKEPTDINELAGEYLKLSYHGFRTREKSFNAILNTQFDTTMRKVMVVPEDLGRVFLNIFNNAFYSISQKKLKKGPAFEGAIFINTKTITTSEGEEMAEIRIHDNGLGIPQKIIDKIFQPFFTTKPAGQGTGLGLSLSYDIIAKEHGGTITVETREGEFTEFIIRLPLK